MILVNGKIVTLDAVSSLRRRWRSVTATSRRSVANRPSGIAGTKTRVVDLGGKMVVPGLIDSHIHAIRTALTFGIETDWSSVRSLGGLKIIADAARAKPGAWIVVGGGWHEGQLKEHRGPTAVNSPKRRRTIRSMYSISRLCGHQSQGMATLGIHSDADIPPAGSWCETLTTSRPGSCMVTSLPSASCLPRLDGWLRWTRREYESVFQGDESGRPDRHHRCGGRRHAAAKLLPPVPGLAAARVLAARHIMSMARRRRRRLRISSSFSGDTGEFRRRRLRSSA